MAKSTSARSTKPIFTIGHSTRSADEFCELLKKYGVELLVDVRRFPGSRRYPHFNSEALARSLAEIGADYVHEPALGGRRDAEGDSPNTYWRNASFRAYADYMASGEFQEALARLGEQSQKRTQAIMCAEAVPWRCHRQLIADALVAQGRPVLHIIDLARADSHVLNEHAHEQPQGHLVYRAAETQQKLFDERK